MTTVESVIRRRTPLREVIKALRCSSGTLPRRVRPRAGGSG
jgi:hypothetical protein